MTQRTQSDISIFFLRWQRRFLWITERLVLNMRVTSFSLRPKRRGCLKGSSSLFTKSQIKELQTGPQMNEWMHTTAAPWWQVSEVHGHQKRKHVKDQMPATTWNQRRRHTARHLLPFRGSCRGSAGFIMDVMESRPRSEHNHHSDTSPSRQLCSSEHRRHSKSCLTHNNNRR